MSFNDNEVNQDFHMDGSYAENESPKKENASTMYESSRENSVAGENTSTSSAATAIDLERHSIDQNIWILAGPLIAERVLQALVDAADMAMVGRVGEAAVAAVGLSNQLSMFATSFYDAIRVGTTAVVARRIGQGLFEESRQTLRQSLIIAALLGIAAFVVLSSFAAESLAFMGAENDVIAEGVPYFFWKGVSLLFMFGSMTFNAALRGAGEARIPLYSGIVVNTLNLFGNYVLIEGRWGFPRMGTEGAGLSTAISRLAGLLVLIILITIRSNPLKGWVKGSFKPKRSILEPILKIGLPASGERLTFRGAQILYTRAIAGLGTAAYAAHQVAMRTESVSLVIGFAFGATATTLVGQYLGFGDDERAELAAKRCRYLATLAMSVAGVLLFVFAAPVIGLFVPDSSEVTRMGSEVIKIVAVAQPFMAINHVLAGALRGAGDTKWVMYIQSGSAWCLRVTLTYLLVGSFGLRGAWYAMVADLFVRALFLQWRFGAGHWKRIRV